MSAAELAVTLAKRFEGLSLKPYFDPVGLPTVGYGHLLSTEAGADLSKWRALTEDEAEALLLQDIRGAFKIVAALVKVPLTDGQAAALGDFCFNLGWNLRGSTLLARLNRGDYAGAADQFGRWVYSRKRKLPGLVVRREAERALFVS